MRELALVSKKPGSHTYKQTTVERSDIPNILNRELDVRAPTKSGASISPTSGPWEKFVLDLCSRRIVGWALSEMPDAELVIKALDVDLTVG